MNKRNKKNKNKKKNQINNDAPENDNQNNQETQETNDIQSSEISDQQPTEIQESINNPQVSEVETTEQQSLSKDNTENNNENITTETKEIISENVLPVESNDVVNSPDLNNENIDHHNTENIETSDNKEEKEQKIIKFLQIRIENYFSHLSKFLEFKKSNGHLENIDMICYIKYKYLNRWRVIQTPSVNEANTLTGNAVENIKTVGEQVETKVPEEEVKREVKHVISKKATNLFDGKKDIIVGQKPVKQLEDDKSAEEGKKNLVVKKLSLADFNKNVEESKSDELSENEILGEGESVDDMSEYSVSVKDQEVQRIVLKVRVSGPQAIIANAEETTMDIQERLQKESKEIFQGEQHVNLDDSKNPIDDQDDGLPEAPTKKDRIVGKVSVDKKDTSVSQKLEKFSEVPNSYSEQTSLGNMRKSKVDEIRLIDEINIDKEKNPILEEIRKNNNLKTENNIFKTRTGVCSKCIIY